jgi:hypothetical protein
MLQSRANQGFSRFRFGVRILPKHVDLYEKVRAILDSPIPCDPELRRRRQQAYQDACAELHSELGLTENETDIMDTYGFEQVPAFVVQMGDRRVDDWTKAMAIRVRLEQLYWGRRR